MTTRTLLVACVLAASGALSARAEAADAPPPPAASAPQPAQPPAPPPPTAVEMAPITVPSNSTKDSDFATRLKAVCAQMLPAAGDPTTVANFVAAGLSGLQQACADIPSGKTLSAADVAALRAFWTNPSQVENQIAKALTPAAKALILKMQATQQGGNPSSNVSSGSLESDVIQGLADFVYDRAKQEATLYLTQQLTEKLCTGVPLLFFPAVCVALPTDPTIPLGAMGSYLAAAARTDLSRLPDRTLAYSLHDFGKAQEHTPKAEAFFGARLSLAYYGTVRTGRTPLDVARSMHELRVDPTVVGSNTQVRKATAVLSELVDSVQAQTGWINLLSLSPGMTDLSYYALGAVFTFESQYATDGNPFGPIPDDKIAAAIPVLSQYLIDVANLGARAAATKQAAGSRGDFKGATGNNTSSNNASSLTPLDYMVVATQTLPQTFQSGQKVLTSLGIDVSGSVTAMLGALEAVSEIGEWASSGQPTADLVVMLPELFNQLTAALPSGVSAPKELIDIQQLLALVAQIAQAKSADEVATILSAAAVPPAAYRLKYQTGVVALGAMAGISGGAEWVRANGSTSSAGVVGTFAPVGLTGSIPLGSWMYGGVMFSVINLGALVSARFSQDLKTTTTAAGTTTMTVQSVPEVKLANVLAPGAFVTLGIARSPFTLSLGAQVVPEARQVITVAPDGTTSTSTASAVQFLGVLAVDVPILTF